VGSSGDPFGESRLPESSGNIARSHKSRREEQLRKMIKYNELQLTEIYFTSGSCEYTTDNNSYNIYLWLVYHMQSFGQARSSYIH
jgi:hypothetical protein